jgi:hypothetical protein
MKDVKLQTPEVMVLRFGFRQLRRAWKIWEQSGMLPRGGQCLEELEWKGIIDDVANCLSSRYYDGFLKEESDFAACLIAAEVASLLSPDCDEYVPGREEEIETCRSANVGVFEQLISKLDNARQAAVKEREAAIEAKKKAAAWDPFRQCCDWDRFQSWVRPYCKVWFGTIQNMFNLRNRLRLASTNNKADPLSRLFEITPHL